MFAFRTRYQLIDFTAGICLAKEFAEVTENAFMKETRNAVKHAAETVRNKTGIVPQEHGSDDSNDE